MTQVLRATFAWAREESGQLEVNFPTHDIAGNVVACHVYVIDDGQDAVAVMRLRVGNSEVILPENGLPASEFSCIPLKLAVRVVSLSTLWLQFRGGDVHGHALLVVHEQNEAPPPPPVYTLGLLPTR